MTNSKKNNGRLGTHHSETTKQKMREAALGRKATPETLAKMSAISKARYDKGEIDFGGKPFTKGSKHTLEARKKIVEAQLGRKYPYRAYPDRRGAKSHLWRGGVAKVNDVIKHSNEYKQWRKAVFERDNYTCQWCGIAGVQLNADHIKPFADYPEQRFSLDNGRTLCVPCHKQTDTWGSRTLWRKYEKV